MDNERIIQHVSRRRVLLGCGAGLTTIALAGCTEDNGSSDETPDADDSESNGYRIQVTVIGHGELIDGATVTVEGEQEETGEEGLANFEELPEGNYQIEVDASGWQSKSRNVTIPVDGLQTKIVRVELDPAD